MNCVCNQSDNFNLKVNIVSITLGWAWKLTPIAIFNRLLHIAEITDHWVIDVCQTVYLATCEDYKLLENMNKVTGLKYLEMKEIAVNINRNLKDLNQKCE